VIGEIMADLVTEGQSPLDLRMFSAARFERPPVVE
jgi:hypothetical protein